MSRWEELTRSAEAQGLLFPFESLQVLQTSAVTGQNVHEAFEQLSLAVQDALCRHFTWQEWVAMARSGSTGYACRLLGEL